MDIDTEKFIMKDKAKHEYKKLLNAEIEVDSKLESAGNDDEEGETKAMSDLGPSSDSRVEKVEDNDVSDSDFESERDDISDSEDVDVETMKKSFQNV